MYAIYSLNECSQSTAERPCYGLYAITALVRMYYSCALNLRRYFPSPTASLNGLNSATLRPDTRVKLNNGFPFGFESAAKTADLNHYTGVPHACASCTCAARKASEHGRTSYAPMHARSVLRYVALSAKRVINGSPRCTTPGNEHVRDVRALRARSSFRSIAGVHRARVVPSGPTTNRTVVLPSHPTIKRLKTGTGRIARAVHPRTRSIAIRTRLCSVFRTVANHVCAHRKHASSSPVTAGRIRGNSAPPSPARALKSSSPASAARRTMRLVLRSRTILRVCSESFCLLSNPGIVQRLDDIYISQEPHGHLGNV